MFDWHNATDVKYNRIQQEWVMDRIGEDQRWKSMPGTNIIDLGTVHNRSSNAPQVSEPPHGIEQGEGAESETELDEDRISQL
ncbi:MAG: hypothetical protein JWO40_137 [Candidatus Doudnabacteria bacterium]|nr:hypothetical protein [Candidatus Doudnabacteria bacterium]